jgi:hypothetical protein
MIKTMIARYPGRDAITGHQIRPGDEIQYDTATRKAWIHEPGDMESAPVHTALGAIVFYGQHGPTTHYRNPRGRCEDAHRCGCCTI